MGMLLWLTSVGIDFAKQFSIPVCMLARYLASSAGSPQLHMQVVCMAHVGHTRETQQKGSKGLVADTPKAHAVLGQTNTAIRVDGAASGHPFKFKHTGVGLTVPGMKLAGSTRIPTRLPLHLVALCETGHAVPTVASDRLLREAH